MVLISGCTFSKNPQGSKEWLEERHNVLTGSVAEAWMGLSRFQSRETVSKIIKGEHKVEISEAMLNGTKYEPHIRKAYLDILNEKKNGYTIEEKGLAIWDEDPIFGTSVDGIITSPSGKQYCLEIKTTSKTIDKFFGDALRYFNESVPSPNLDKCVPSSHLLQMWQACAITGLPNCHYVVYSTASEELNYMVVPANPEYWSFMVSEGREFYKEFLADRSGKKNRPNDK